MPLPQQFLKELPEKTDEQLYDMLGHADDYMPEALEAARTELRRRKLPPERAVKIVTMSEQCQNMVIIDPQPPGKSPGLLSKRGIRFLVGGLIGGTLIVTCISFAMDDWSYLYRWLSGLAVVVMVFVYVFCKKWLTRRAMHLVQTHVQPQSTKASHDA